MYSQYIIHVHFISYRDYSEERTSYNNPDDIARHAKQRVGDKEQSGAETVDRVTEVQVAAHLHLREADVDTVQVGEQVTHQQQRHQAPRH